MSVVHVYIMCIDLSCFNNYINLKIMKSTNLGDLFESQITHTFIKFSLYLKSSEEVFKTTTICHVLGFLSCDRLSKYAYFNNVLQLNNRTRLLIISLSHILKKKKNGLKIQMRCFGFQVGKIFCPTNLTTRNSLVLKTGSCQFTNRQLVTVCNNG